MEESLQVFLIFILLFCQEPLLQGLLEVGGSVCNQNTHIMYAFRTLMPEVLDKQISFLLILLHLKRKIFELGITGQMGPPALHSAACNYEVVVTHVCGCIWYTPHTFLFGFQ